MTNIIKTESRKGNPAVQTITDSQRQTSTITKSRESTVSFPPSAPSPLSPRLVLLNHKLLLVQPEREPSCRSYHVCVLTMCSYHVSPTLSPSEPQTSTTPVSVRTVTRRASRWFVPITQHVEVPGASGTPDRATV